MKRRRERQDKKGSAQLSSNSSFLPLLCPHSSPSLSSRAQRQRALKYIAISVQYSELEFENCYVGSM